MTPEAIFSSSALITKVKRPKVMILIGSVNMNRIGRNKAFKIPRTAAAQKALKNPLTLMPSIRYEAAVMATVSMNHLIKIPIITCSSKFFIVINGGKPMRLWAAYRYKESQFYLPGFPISSGFNPVWLRSFKGFKGLEDK
jgi:hypothetical protein